MKRIAPFIFVASIPVALIAPSSLFAIPAQFVAGWLGAFAHLFAVGSSAEKVAFIVGAAVPFVALLADHRH